MPAMLSKITCPYCFETFNAADAKFRCINPRCKREEDNLLSSARNLRIPPSLGHIFERKAATFKDRLLNSITTALAELLRSRAPIKSESMNVLVPADSGKFRLTYPAPTS